MAKYADIIIDITAEAVDRPFTYRIPDSLSERMEIGARVRVPFGNRGALRTGYVIGLSDEIDYDESKIKEISGMTPGAIGADRDRIGLAVFLAKTYGSTLNQALKTVLPIRQSVRKNRRRTDPVHVIGGMTGSEEAAHALPPLNAEQRQAADALCSAMTALWEESGSAQSVSDTVPCSLHDPSSSEAAQPQQSGAGLASDPSADQDSGRDSSRIPRTNLLYGVTGSGKTMVYLKLIEYARSRGREAIVLIPEISLTYQTVRVLSAHFGEDVAVLHSRLSVGERYEQYQKAAEGKIGIMVGPRSALFAPFSHLGLIVIDEEHERSYHSDTAPRYDAREVAAKRAEMDGAMLLLGSATPSLKSYMRALDGTYGLFCLTKRAVPGAALPNVHVVDLRAELASGNRSIFSECLASLMDMRLKKGEQIMLFINRRGYAGFVSCRSCGYVMKCPHCDVSLTAHNSWYYDRQTGKREGALLVCHYCGYEAPMPSRCPSCKSPYIAPFGTGTQKLEQEVRKAFPGARVLRMDADSTARKYAHETLLAAFQNGEADILIGTQMIVKGHDFPRVTLVGIVAADLSLNVPEYDAPERTFQLLTQAAGRAGRGTLAGDVVIQTYEPSHYAIACAANQDYEAFYKREMSYRRLMHYPPVCSMLCIRFQSEDEALCAEGAQAACSEIEEEAKRLSAELIGPCRASLYKLNDNYRKILYIKHREHAIIQKLRGAVHDFVTQRYKGRPIYLSYDFL